jgi:hypothetical protein
VEMAPRRAENSRLQTGEQPGDFPAVGSNKVAMRPWWTVNQTLQPQPTKIICHLVGSVVRHRYTRIRRSGKFRTFVARNDCGHTAYAGPKPFSGTGAPRSRNQGQCGGLPADHSVDVRGDCRLSGTALMAAAATPGSAPVVRMLLAPC